MKWALAPTLLALTVAVLVGCAGKSDPSAEAETAAGPPPAVYSVRGVIAELPPEDTPRDWVRVQHEAIPDFIGFEGEPEPMHAMTMRFPVAEGVDLADSAVGDKIAFDMEVDWSGGELTRILTVSPLPPETELDLGGM